MYINNVIHAYHLNDREIKTSQKGYTFFANKNNTAKYKTQTLKIKNLIKQVTDDYEKLKISELSHSELKKRFFELINVLNAYSNIYSKTEPFVLSKIEANEKKYITLVKELGEIRFMLRKESEPLSYWQG